MPGRFLNIPLDLLRIYCHTPGCLHLSYSRRVSRRRKKNEIARGKPRFPAARYATGKIEPITIRYVFLFHIVIFSSSTPYFLPSPLRGEDQGEGALLISLTIPGFITNADRINIIVDTAV